MDFLFGRYRNLTILVGVLFLQMLGLAIQVKRMADHQDTRLIRIWAVNTITPFEKAIVWVQNGGNHLWSDYFFLRGVRAENRDLKKQIEDMRLDQVRLSEDAEQAHRLQHLLAFQEQVITRTVPAQVIGASGSDLSRTVYIDKGSNAGIAPDMAVITANGIVGKVLRVFPSTSLILMLNDQSSGVGAMIEKTRLQGVIRGTADGQVVLERVMSDETVKPGETILSSGGDQIFPKGMPLGTVMEVKPGHEMFLNILVKPAADLSRLEEVLVVTQKEERSPAVETATRVRAADILADRLPSVPDKPATPAATAAAAGTAVSKPVEPNSATGAASAPAPLANATTHSSPSGASAGPPGTAGKPAAPKSLSAASFTASRNADTANSKTAPSNPISQRRVPAQPAPAPQVDSTDDAH